MNQRRHRLQYMEIASGHRAAQIGTPIRAQRYNSDAHRPHRVSEYQFPGNLSISGGKIPRADPPICGGPADRGRHLAVHRAQIDLHPAPHAAAIDDISLSDK